MINWIATWKAIADAWILQTDGEDPDWIGEQLCALVRCDSAAALEAWAKDVGLKGIEKMIVRRETA